MNMSSSTSVAHSSSSVRGEFIRKTYLHLLLAIAAFTGLEIALFKSGAAERIFQMAVNTNWLLILGGFMMVSFIATRFAQSSKSLGSQYFGLSLYVVAQALLFVPMLYIAEHKSGGGVIESAATATLLGFGGLTAIAFGTRMDFSWLGKFIALASVAALVLIVCGVLFGFSLGVFFSVAMIVVAGAAILYDTSNIIHRYGEEQYVAAALQLFASIALMFWYLLSFFNSRD